MEEDNNTSTTNKKFYKNKHILLAAAFGVVLIGIAVWFITKPNKSVAPAMPKTASNYLSNGNTVVCTIDTAKLTCQDLQAAQTRTFVVPLAYQNATVVSASPDGTKLLLYMANNDILVTTPEFTEPKTVFKGGSAGVGAPVTNWGQDSNSVLVSNLMREQNDADFLPEPLVVQIFDLTTNQSRRVYKTGEKVDVGAFETLGSNDKYVFISYQTPKNWVAQSIDQPQPIVYAISINNGEVLPVNTHQILTHNLFYDSGKNIFIALSQNSTNPANSDVHVAELESNEFGLVLKKKLTLTTTQVDNTIHPIFTFGGIQAINIGKLGNFRVVKDDGTITELKLTNSVTNAYGNVFSLKTMPKLQQ